MSPVRLHPVQPFAEADTQTDDSAQQSFDFRGPWFDTKTGAAYVGNRSVGGFREWCRRHFIVARTSGIARYAKADLDRAMKAKRPARVISAASLANLALGRKRA